MELVWAAAFAPSKPRICGTAMDARIDRKMAYASKLMRMDDDFYEALSYRKERSRSSASAEKAK